MDKIKNNSPNDSPSDSRLIFSLISRFEDSNKLFLYSKISMYLFFGICGFLLNFLKPSWSNKILIVLTVNRFILAIVIVFFSEMLYLFVLYYFKKKKVDSYSKEMKETTASFIRLISISFFIPIFFLVILQNQLPTIILYYLSFMLIFTMTSYLNLTLANSRHRIEFKLLNDNSETYSVYAYETYQLFGIHLHKTFSVFHKNEIPLEIIIQRKEYKKGKFLFFTFNSLYDITVMTKNEIDVLCNNQEPYQSSLFEYKYDIGLSLPNSAPVLLITNIDKKTNCSILSKFASLPVSVKIIQPNYGKLRIYQLKSKRKFTSEFLY